MPGPSYLDETGLRLQPDEIQRRLIVRAIMWVSGSDYAPRRAAVANVIASLRKGQAGTVDGCHIRRIAAQIWIFREHQALRNLSLPTGCAVGRTLADAAFGRGETSTASDGTGPGDGRA